MKLIAAVALASVASCSAAAIRPSPIENLKSLVERSSSLTEDRMFAAEDGFTSEGGKISFKVDVSNKQLQVPMPSFIQSGGWFQLRQSKELNDQGYVSWRADKDGILLTSADGSKVMSCDAPDTPPETSKDNKAKLTFDCKTSSNDDVRFKAVPYVALGTQPNAYLPNASDTFWLPVSNAMSGCLPMNFNTYNYDYYAYSPMGVWGCPSLTNNMCNVNPYFYAFSP